jgi:predicted nucleotidyltransferase
MNHQSSIEKLGKALRDHLGHKIARILVFGSVARGTDTAASDIDVVIILDMPPESVGWQIERQIREVIYPVELEDDVVFDLKVVAKSELQGLRGHTPFMEAVSSQGIAV